jgi:hypothetical protein
MNITKGIILERLILRKKSQNFSTTPKKVHGILQNYAMSWEEGGVGGVGGRGV